MTTATRKMLRSYGHERLPTIIRRGDKLYRLAAAAPKGFTLYVCDERVRKFGHMKGRIFYVCRDEDGTVMNWEHISRRNMPCPPPFGYWQWLRGMRP